MATKEFDTSNLKPGMIVAEPIITRRGQELAKAGSELTAALIARLSFYKIESVVVETKVDFDNIPKPEPKPEQKAEPPKAKPTWIEESESYSHRIRKSKDFQDFQIQYGKFLSLLKDEFDAYEKNERSVDCGMLYEEMTPLFQGKTSIQMFDMIHNIRQVDDSTYAHSLNVALVSRIIGRWCKFSTEDIEVLTIAGLLHDIGKIQIPENVLNKPGRYTDEEFALIQKHPKMSYDILKKSTLDPRIKKAALQHHERCDGSGYPMGLDSDEIENFSCIVAIADVYDAMTAARSYRQPMCPFEVIAAFEKDGLSKYKPQFVLTFLERIAATYQNNRIILNDGRSANIVLLNKNHISKPMVQLTDGNCLDLSREPGLFIKSVL